MRHRLFLFCVEFRTARERAKTDLKVVLARVLIAETELDMAEADVAQEEAAVAETEAALALLSDGRLKRQLEQAQVRQWAVLSQKKARAGTKANSLELMQERESLAHEKAALPSCRSRALRVSPTSDARVI